MPEYREVKQAFKPRARMLLLLGDQLIRDPGIAVFELVKNAYDADSTDTTITMSGAGGATPADVRVVAAVISRTRVLQASPPLTSPEAKGD